MDIPQGHIIDNIDSYNSNSIKYYDSRQIVEEMYRLGLDPINIIRERKRDILELQRLELTDIPLLYDEIEPFWSTMILVGDKIRITVPQPETLLWLLNRSGFKTRYNSYDGNLLIENAKELFQDLILFRKLKWEIN